MSNYIPFLSGSNPDPALNHSLQGNTPQLNYFDIISNRLDSWEAKQAIREAQVKKTFLLQDPDATTGVVKTYRLTIELIATEQADVLFDGEEPDVYAN